VNAWDQRYAEPGYAYGTRPNDFLAAVVDRLPKGRVLSLAEGEGRNGLFLASRGFDVTGIDQSAVGLEKARAQARERGLALTTLVMDLADFRIEPGHWAVIVSIFCHLPSAIRRRLSREAATGLVCGGALVLEAYTPHQIGRGTGGPQDPDLMPTLEELRSDLAGLSFEIAQETEREVREGRFHTGRGAVVQILAFRNP
jgi:SAM-dependent methyltransferase